MRGLIEGDPTINERFLRFFAVVQGEAAKMGKVFFVSTGYGDVEDNGALECETLIGWLVNADEADDFQAIWEDDLVDDAFDNLIFSVKWTLVKDGVDIQFDKLIPNEGESVHEA